jgi:hypothetical protein
MWSSLLDCCNAYKQKEQQRRSHISTSSTRSPLLTENSDEFSTVLQSHIKSQTIACTEPIPIDVLLKEMNFDIDVVDNTVDLFPTSSLVTANGQRGCNVSVNKRFAGNNRNVITLPENTEHLKTVDCIEPIEHSIGSNSSSSIPKRLFQHLQRRLSSTSNSSMGDSNATDHSDSWWTYSDDEEIEAFVMSSIVSSINNMEQKEQYVKYRQHSQYNDGGGVELQPNSHNCIDDLSISPKIETGKRKLPARRSDSPKDKRQEISRSTATTKDKPKETPHTAPIPLLKGTPLQQHPFPKSSLLVVQRFRLSVIAR